MTPTSHSHAALAIKEAAHDPAPSERKHQAQYNLYPPSWRKLIESLELQQLKLRALKALGSDWSDKTFTSGSQMPASTWNMLRSGKHPPPTGRGEESLLTKLRSLETALREVDLRVRDAALRESKTQSSAILAGFVEDVNTQAVVAAIQKCDQTARESGEDRLIVLRAATGAGKTWLRKWAVAQKHVHYVVSARPSWRRNYRAFLRALAAVLNLDVIGTRGVSDLEDRIIEKTQTLHGVVWLEEVQSLSGQAQEFIKLLLNETHLSLILAVTPESYTVMRHTAGGDALQLFRRAACNMELAHADARFLEAAAPDLWSREHVPACQQRILAEAELFGGRALIADVHRRLRLRIKGSAIISLADVEACLAAYRANVPDLAAARRAFGGQKTEGRAA